MSKDKKHPCVDCKMCQWCSDDRCRLCLRGECKMKLSIAEQIELYEKLNAKKTDKSHHLHTLQFDKGSKP